MKAKQIQVGDFIADFGRVTSVHRFDKEVADRKSSMTKMPSEKGALLGARLIAEAQEHAYDKKPGSITFCNAMGKQLSRLPDDNVKVYTVHKPQKAVAAA